MNRFGAEPLGILRSHRPDHRRHAHSSVKAQVFHAETTLHRYRARAAAILHAEGLHEEGEAPHSTYVFKIIRIRETGARVRVLDTLADDAPRQEGADVVHQYLVQCRTHGRRGRSFASARAAVVAARRPEQWCPRCADLVRSGASPAPRAPRRGPRDSGTGRASG